MNRYASRTVRSRSDGPRYSYPKRYAVTKSGHQKEIQRSGDRLPTPGCFDGSVAQGRGGAIADIQNLRF